jgi:hypothetical protein
LLTLLATLLCLPACSVDELRNVQRMDCKECEKLGGTCVLDKFCLPGDAGTAPVRDAAVKDASDDDANTGDAAVDAGGRMPCREEGEMRSCSTQDAATSQQLPCKPGTRTCHDGFFGDCEGEVTPEIEICNGRDDDCDGTADEMPENRCNIKDAQGECAIGIEVCRNKTVECRLQHAPQSDTCNGKDDDCDGETDEETAVVCYPDDAIGCEANAAGEFECVGTCRAGTRACTDGAYAETCGGDSIVPASAEICTGSGESSSDEDCDGKIDEGCGCSAGSSCYTGPAETQAHAPCHAGTWDCSGDNHTCTGEVKPTPETCGNPGVDNDCDGVVDNIPALGTSCSGQSTGRGICKAGARWRCRNGARTCVDAEPSAEICDAQERDEDCDGMNNENFDVATDEENCGACGVVCAAGLQCCDGRCVNTSTSNANCSLCGNQCGAGETCCTGGCVNTLTNPMNCGTCGHVCSGLLKGCKDGACTKLLL